jgi:hypothetical protein
MPPHSMSNLDAILLPHYDGLLRAARRHIDRPRQDERAMTAETHASAIAGTAWCIR